MQLLRQLVIGVLTYLGVLHGILAIILLLLATVFVLTSFVGFCPLYALFGISTCKK